MSNIEKIKDEIERRKKRWMYDDLPIAMGRYYEDRDLLSFIDSLPEEKPPEDFPTSDEEMAKFLATHPKVEVPEKYKTPNWLFDKQHSEDLEEAAYKYSFESRPSVYGQVDVIDAFIAGAEWQKVQDEPYMKRNNLELSFMLENARKGGILEGKAEMMKDAEEGEIGYWNQRGLSIRLDQSLEKLGYDEDTKVEVIIKKKD